MADSSASSDRIAELKRKMQESAAKRQAEAAAAAGETDATEPVAAGTPAASAPDASAPDASVESAPVVAASAEGEAAVAEPVTDAPVEAAADTVVTAEAGDDNLPVAQAESSDTPAAEVGAIAEEAAAPAAEAAPVLAEAAGAPAAAAAAASDDPALPAGLTQEQREQREMSRRELMTFAWGGALLLIGGAVGYGLFEFMYPRFRAGEFGGDFFIATSEVPPVDSGPTPFTAGKFWLVQAEEEGPKALYMVCTHLGCLYKWEPSNFRFECPCHGSKFSKDGFYIEGPAPRSLDRFVTEVDGETLVVHTGQKIPGLPSGLSPARAAA